MLIAMATSRDDNAAEYYNDETSSINSSSASSYVPNRDHKENFRGEIHAEDVNSNEFSL